MTTEAIELADMIDRSEETTSLQCPVCDSDFFVKGEYTPLYSTAFAEELL